MYHSPFICIYIDECLGSCQILAIASQSFTSRVVWTYTFGCLGKGQDAWLLGPRANWCLALWKPSRPSSKLQHHFACLPVLLHIPTIFDIRVLDFGHCSRSAVVSRYYFSLQFPNDMWFQTSSICLLTTCIYSLGEVYGGILPSFYCWVLGLLFKFEFG